MTHRYARERRDVRRRARGLETALRRSGPSSPLAGKRRCARSPFGPLQRFERQCERGFGGLRKFEGLGGSDA
jgi:hypothetical protein